MRVLVLVLDRGDGSEDVPPRVVAVAKDDDDPGGWYLCGWYVNDLSVEVDSVPSHSLDRWVERATEESFAVLGERTVVVEGCGHPMFAVDSCCDTTLRAAVAKARAAMPVRAGQGMGRRFLVGTMSRGARGRLITGTMERREDVSMEAYAEYREDLGELDRRGPAHLSAAAPGRPWDRSDP